MKKIKIPKATKEQRIKAYKKRIEKKQLAMIEAKYTRKMSKLLEAYQDKTMDELWVALDIIKEQMRKELNAIGIE